LHESSVMQYPGQSLSRHQALPIECSTAMETSESDSHQSVGGLSADQVKELNLSMLDSAAPVRGELENLKLEHARYSELVSILKTKTAQMQQALNEGRENLSAIEEAAQAQMAAHRETIAQLTQAHYERSALEENLVPLREEVDGRIKAREALIEEAVMLHRHVSELSARKETYAAEFSALENAHSDLRERVDRLRSEHSSLVEQIEALRRTVSLHAGVSDRLMTGPLWFGTGLQEIAPEWDSYPLESEFHTEDELDARKVAELVSTLPGLDGCMLAKNHGAVLASQLPERLHAILTVPDRNYELLFDHLENKVEDRNIENARIATFELGCGALTIAQSDHAFLFANHKETKLRPGLAGKLAAIVSEVAKMYP
jgi:hypothetical protein